LTGGIPSRTTRPAPITRFLRQFPTGIRYLLARALCFAARLVLLGARTTAQDSTCRYEKCDMNPWSYGLTVRADEKRCGGAVLILFDRRVSVDSHGAGGGRNWADPVTWHRDTGCCSKRVAHFRHGLHDPLWLCREHYVFVRISSKCRCAKCEREHDTRAPNRRTAQATKPVFHSHTVIVIQFRILGKLI
jgi:hypothetical protein